MNILRMRTSNTGVNAKKTSDPGMAICTMIMVILDTPVTGVKIKEMDMGLLIGKMANLNTKGAGRTIVQMAME